MKLLPILTVGAGTTWQATGFVPSIKARTISPTIVTSRFPGRYTSSISHTDISLAVDGVPPFPKDVDEQPIIPGFPLSRSETIPFPTDRVGKFLKLKDILWVREAAEDLAAAEFACSVESTTITTTRDAMVGDLSLTQPQRHGRAVDYEKLLSKLNHRLEDMIHQPVHDFNGTIPKLSEDCGMGRFVYPSNQRQKLLKQILRARKGLLDVMNGHQTVVWDEKLNPPIAHFEVPEIPELSVVMSNVSPSMGPKLYVRDDGTVDWEGALHNKKALAKFGRTLWARINGQTPDDWTTNSPISPYIGTHNATDTFELAVTAEIQDTQAIVNAREVLNKLQMALQNQTKAHRELLHKSIPEGQATANVRLASLDPTTRSKIRLSAESLRAMEQEVAYQSLVYDLERIYTYLAAELGNPTAKGYPPLPDRLNVAEYGLLEKQVESCGQELNQNGLLDADVLAVIAEQMADFKRRLGIDTFIPSITYNEESVRTRISDIMKMAKRGLLFYAKGCQLFWSDIVYCSNLIVRAAQGHTLKPREVRTLRRTFQDVLTFIPVTIILLIPLTPPGHVLLFGSIQRFFPSFFPSCFSQQRQNLLQLYESAEFSEMTINESVPERMLRVFHAMIHYMARSSRQLYNSVITMTGDRRGNHRPEKNTSGRSQWDHLFQYP